MSLPFPVSRASRPDVETLLSLRETCFRLLEQPEAFAVALRHNFRQSVIGDPPDQATCEAAAHLAETVVSSLVREPDLDQVEALWSSAAAGHAALLSSDALVAAVGKALVRSVRDVLAEEWSSSMGSCWIALQLWLVPPLTAGARHARAAAPSAPPPTRVPPATTVSGRLWAPPPQQSPPDGAETASRHDRKRRGGMRRSSGGDEWVP